MAIENVDINYDSFLNVKKNEDVLEKEDSTTIEDVSDTNNKIYGRLKIYKDRPDISFKLFNSKDDEAPIKEIILPKKDVREVLEYLYRG